MSSNEDILRARSFYYEFLAAPFFFSEDDKRFKTWRTQLAELAENPLNEAVALAFSELGAFDFATFAREQNNVLFDYSYANVPLTASFYEEGHDEGVARVRTIEILKKSPYRRDADACKNSEDYVGFIFYLMATFLRDEIKSGATNEDVPLSEQLFVNVINGFADEFCQMLKEHEKSQFFRSLAVVLENFIALERSVLAVQAPHKDPNKRSAAQISMEKKPYKTKMTLPKSAFEEF